VLERHVTYLAADALGGREIGSPGIVTAEDYIAETFNGFGLENYPGATRFLGFPLYTDGYDGSRSRLTIHTDGSEVHGALGRDFRVFPFSSPGTVAAPLVFAGYGITAPEYGYDDYEGLDVTGKLALVLRYEPEEADPDSVFAGTRTTEHSYFVRKAQRARENGAAGMVLVTNALHHDPYEDLRPRRRYALDPADLPGEDSDTDESPLVAVHVSQALARAAMSESDLSLKAVQRAVDGGSTPASLQLQLPKVTLILKRQAEPGRIPVRNVAGVVRGTDPTLSDEWIIVGAHHDHLGAYDAPADSVYNGADDNASGTAAVLALADHFSRPDRRPKRSMLFVTFTAEEVGLWGSRWLAERMRSDGLHVALMVNLDMIGRNPGKPVQIFGQGTLPQLRELVETRNTELGLALRFHDQVPENSDHAPFHRDGVPVISLFTGVHEDYHGVGDSAGKLDYLRMTRIVRLVAAVLETVASGETVSVDERNAA
jgi:hypothetical protein